MSIIHTVISPAQLNRLSQKDNTYLKHRLDDNCALSALLNKPVNRPLLAELQCILDKKPIVRRNTERHSRNGKVYVYDSEHKLLRILHANGKVMRVI